MVQVAGFRHLVLVRGDLEAASRIHVYLEGDGTPWISRHRVAADPTPRHPLASRLMALDPTPAILVGRPCYHGLAESEGCSPWLWTHGRYGEAVVASLASAIDRVLPGREERRLTLIGYSGGGTLAVLLAPRLRGVERVVTLAANLDVRAWADRHGYDRLSGSLDPADQPPLDPSIQQIHLLGARDRQVPPESIRRYLARNPNAVARVVPGFDHRCCWVEHWPTGLDQ